MNSVAVSAVSQTSANSSSLSPRMRPDGDRLARLNVTVSRAISGDSTTSAIARAITSGASTARRSSLGGSIGSSRPRVVAGSVTVKLGEIPRGRGVRTLDARRDLSLVAVAQLRQI
jgi:hypothetical protein